MHRERKPHFFSSSLLHLSDVQQRQVGALLGASVADAAVRAVDGATAEEIASAVERAAALGAPMMDDDPGDSSDPRDPCFLPGAIHPPTTVPLHGPLLHHSLVHEAMSALLTTVATNQARLDAEMFRRHAWPLVFDAVPRQLSETSFRAPPATLADAAVAAPVLAALYPYAHEEDRQLYLDAVHASLRPNTAEDSADGVEAIPGGCATTRALASSWAAVLSRYMMRNPDAVVNAAHRADPLVAGTMFGAGEPPRTTAAVTRESPMWAAAESRFALQVIRRSGGFAAGIRHVARRGGPGAAPTAVLVGACLGAKLGPRAIPNTWVQATPGIELVAQQAIELATWSWNPPGR